MLTPVPMKTTELSIDTFLNFRDGAEIERSPEHRRARPALHRKGRRSLVLTDESAGHPFRRSLPPHVKKDLHDIPAESLWRLTMDDVRGVASTYIATFAAVLVFIM